MGDGGYLVVVGGGYLVVVGGGYLVVVGGGYFVGGGNVCSTIVSSPIGFSLVSSVWEERRAFESLVCCKSTLSLT